MIAARTNRPRNVDAPRAAAILYGDWGTRKACVIRPPLLQPRRNLFPRPDRLHRLARAHDRGWLSVHQNFRRQRTRVVVRRHHETVTAGTQQREVIALAEFRQRTVLGKVIPGLADRTDDVGLDRRAVVLRERDD